MDPQIAEVIEKVHGFGANLDRFLERQEALDVRFKEVEGQVSSFKSTADDLEKWIKEIEDKATKRAQNTYDGASAPLMQAIKDEDRHHIARCEIWANSDNSTLARRARKDPVKMAAVALAVQKTVQMQMKGVGPGLQSTLAEDMDRLRKGFGPELVLKADQSTGSNVGGETLLTPVETEVLRQIQDNGLIRQIARVFPMTAKTHQIPSLDTDVSAAFVSEAGTIADSMSTTNWSQKALTALKLAGRATLSNELINDNAIGMMAFLFGAIAEQIARLEDKDALEGDGTNFTGVNSASGVLTIAAGTDGDAVTYAKIVNAIFKGTEMESRGPSAGFVMAPIEAGMVFKLVDTNGKPIFDTTTIGGQANVMPRGWRGTLMGYPCYTHGGILINRTKGSGTALTNIYFGNFEKLIIGDLLGLQFAVDPYGLFTTDQTRIRVIKRTACVVGVPKAFTVVKDLTTS